MAVHTYEAMIIFPESFKDEALDAALEKVTAEIEKLGGSVKAKTRMGRRTFARPLNKHSGGQYMVLTFRLPAEKVDTLRARFKLNEDVLRVMIARAEEKVEAG